MPLPRTSLWLIGAVALVATAALAGCKHTPPTIAHAPEVDLPRFMGDWYVIASTPTRMDPDAFNAIETYALKDDGNIATTYRYREGGFDGKLNTMHPLGRIVDGYNNAVWTMQFFWPIRAEYVIVDVADDYSHTIVGRSKRDYAWIMARTPDMDEALYQQLLQRLADLGYDTSTLRRVPQQWPESPDAP